MHCVDLGESFPILIPTGIYLQSLASIQPITSLVKFARSPCTDHYYYYRSQVQSRIPFSCNLNDNVFIGMRNNQEGYGRYAKVKRKKNDDGRRQKEEETRWFDLERGYADNSSP